MPEKPENKQKATKKETKNELKKLDKDPYDVLRFVLITEKSVRQIELQNKLVFIVERKSKKNEIKLAVQNAFNSPVSRVNTMIDQTGRKKAFVKFAQPGAAGEIAVRLGII